METQRTEINIRENGDDIFLQCPHCENGESQSVDEQRHHLQTFEILESLDNDADDNQRNFMKCLSCKNEFILTWDYNNILPF